MHPAIRSATGVAGLAAMTMGGPARALDWELADGGKLTFYGLINIAGLFYDDGRPSMTMSPSAIPTPQAGPGCFGHRPMRPGAPGSSSSTSRGRRARSASATRM
ncbi:MAG: hypothetical protein JKP98_21400 [Rhodobacteraceae bacterium]|nr:hypothetical protein [Paracoccaceae bacterium]